MKPTNAVTSNRQSMLQIVACASIHMESVHVALISSQVKVA